MVVPEVRIDDNVFWLHYKVTVWALLICGAFVFLEVAWTSKPIVCGTTLPVDEPFIHNCWRLGLYQSPNIGNLIRLPGIYHYTIVLLLLQALLFYLPHLFWSYMEGGIMEFLTTGMNDSLAFNSLRQHIDEATDRFVANVKFRNTYYWNYFLVQSLNLLNILAQVGGISWLFGINFVTYGPRYFATIKTDYDGSNDYFSRETDFPSIAYCIVPYTGKQNHTLPHFGTCILAVNGINERVYLFIWFWFVFLGILTSIHLIWKLVYAMAPISFPIAVLKTAARARYNHRLLVVQMDSLMKYCGVGDIFILTRMVRFLPLHVMEDFLRTLNQKLATEFKHNLKQQVELQLLTK